MVDEPAPHFGTGAVKCTRRAATHRCFRLLSSPIFSGSDCSGVASARLHDGAALGRGGAPRTQAHRHDYADRSPAVSGNPTGTHQSEGRSGLKAGIALDLAQSGGVQHVKISASLDRLGQDVNARALHVAAQIMTYMHASKHKCEYMCVNLYVNRYVYRCTHTESHTHTHSHSHTHTHICMPAAHTDG
jgi:hypothetical protein